MKMIGTNEPTNYTTEPKPVLVFGASGEQGRAVIEGFIDSGCGGRSIRQYTHLVAIGIVLQIVLVVPTI